MKKIYSLLFIVFSLTGCLEDKEVVRAETRLKDHKFYPDTVYLKENQVLKLTVHNDDPGVEEFESFDLKREKIVAGNSKIIVTMGPLKKGSYEFFGEFNIDTAKGKIIVE